MTERGNIGNIWFVKLGDLYIADVPVFMRRGPSYPNFETNRADFHKWLEEHNMPLMGMGLDVFFTNRDDLMLYLLRWSGD